jgi:hypothetical protein
VAAHRSAGGVGGGRGNPTLGYLPNL